MFNRSYFLRGVAAVATSALILSGCGGNSKTGTSGDTQDQGKIDIVAAIYPYQYIAEQIAGDLATVTPLTEPGADAHSLELTPKQIESVKDADLVIYQSGFQAATDDAVNQQAPAHSLDVSGVVQFMPASHDHDDDESDHDSDQEDSDSHDHSSDDPHVWQDFSNMKAVGTALAEELSEIDPANKATFEQNAQSLSTKLDDLDKQFSDGLANCKINTFVVNHEAFGYLARDYGLNQVGISGLSPEEEPSPARIAQVQKIAEETGVTTIFYETTVSPKVAQTIASDLGLKTALLDPMEAMTDKAAGSDYISVMEANLEALRTANGCS